MKKCRNCGEYCGSEKQGMSKVMTCLMTQRDKLTLKLSRRERALEQFYYFEGDGLRYVTPLGWKDAPDLEEWLENRNKKDAQ